MVVCLVCQLSPVFRNVNNDVAEAMNLSALEGLEERFSHQVSFMISANRGTDDQT